MTDVTDDPDGADGNLTLYLLDLDGNVRDQISDSNNAFLNLWRLELTPVGSSQVWALYNNISGGYNRRVF